jgi:hypothetical protein
MDWLHAVLPKRPHIKIPDVVKEAEGYKYPKVVGACCCTGCVGNPSLKTRNVLSHNFYGRVPLIK